MMVKAKSKEEVKSQDKLQLEHIEDMSQKIFGKPSKDIKYLLVTNYIHRQLLEEELTRTGLYQWINVFRGDVKYPRDVLDYNEYDIVQVNMSSQDVHLIGDIREAIGENSKTKLIVNNDYTTEIWGKAFEYPTLLERELKHPDMLFGTEYFQVTALTEISGRKCYVIPHPADVRRLKSLPIIPQKPIISTIWRRYDNHSYIPSLVVRNHGLTTQLLGFDKKIDPKVHLTTTLYDYVFAGTNYFDFCDQMRESQIVYDPFTYHSFSRATVDTAAMGVAVVGSNRTQSMQVCYPHTCVDPYDVQKARELIDRLLGDEVFYKKVVDTALEMSEFYNHTNSKERYLTALNDTLFGESEKVYPKKYKKELIKGRGDDILSMQAQELNRNGNKKENIGNSLK